MSNPQEDQNADLDGHLSDTHNALLAAAETQGSNDSAESSAEIADFMAAFGSSIHNVLDAPAQEAQEPANNINNFDSQNSEVPEAPNAEEPLDARLAS